MSIADLVSAGDDSPSSGCEQNCDWPPLSMLALSLSQGVNVENGSWSLSVEKLFSKLLEMTQFTLNGTVFL